MGYFALVNSDNIVEQVIVADQNFVNSHPVENKSWIETFTDGSNGKKPAGIGYSYNQELENFIEEKPFPSWSLNSETLDWDPPISRPNDGQMHRWDEDSLSWVVRE